MRMPNIINDLNNPFVQVLLCSTRSIPLVIRTQIPVSLLRSRPTPPRRTSGARTTTALRVHHQDHHPASASTCERVTTSSERPPALHQDTVRLKLTGGLAPLHARRAHRVRAPSAPRRARRRALTLLRLAPLHRLDPTTTSCTRTLLVMINMTRVFSIRCACSRSPGRRQRVEPELTGVR